MTCMSSVYQTGASCANSQRFEVFREVALFALAESQREVPVVVLDHRSKRREAAIVVVAALAVSPQPAQRRRAVAPVGAAIGLEIVDTDLGAGVHVPSGLGEEWRHVAPPAGGLAGEDLLA